jgi:hypothetical protein
MTTEDKSLDIFGLKPIADSVNTVTKGAVDGASSFLGRICLPAAEEFGLLLRDKVGAWRAKNAVAITNQAQKLLENQTGSLNFKAHPRIVYSTLENGSWTEDNHMQDLWAGLLASSCSPDGKDESNLMFANILANLTSSQGKLIKHICESVKVVATKAGWIVTREMYSLDIEQLQEIMVVTDIHLIDRELDYLKALGLIENGFIVGEEKANVSPTSLCLQFYCRCKGRADSLIDFYKAELEVESSPYKELQTQSTPETIL